MTKTITDPTTEILTRARRIETRITEMMLHMGLEPHSQKPTFVDKPGRVDVPARHTPLHAILMAIPVQYVGRRIALFHEDQFIGSIIREV